mmetsp:Transcript_24617/g.52219  ORF Transcript_24617/g.52219 Transcript_24617/m.52219 type:complete len:119 (+) Transcript_24617:50-406(+)
MFMKYSLSSGLGLGSPACCMAQTCKEWPKRLSTSIIAFLKNDPSVHLLRFSSHESNFPQLQTKSDYRIRTQSQLIGQRGTTLAWQHRPRSQGSRSVLSKLLLLWIHANPALPFRRDLL